MAKFHLARGVFSESELLKFSPENETEAKIAEFVAEFRSGKDVFEMKTSGSTGLPKRIQFSRSEVEASAKATLDFFGIKAEQTALLCLNPDFVAGKMMIARALIGNLGLVCREASANPLPREHEIFPVDFAAFVPMQLQKIIEEVPENLLFVKKIILGGAPISEGLLKEIKKLTSEIYHTFGMTETLTHFAVRKLNGADASEEFRVLNHAKAETYGDNLLKINIFGKEIFSNDRVEMRSENSFVWHGREDFVINSGGYKIFPEKLEKDLQAYFSERGIVLNGVLIGIPDDVLGEKCVLIIEESCQAREEDIFEFARRNFHPYEVPKAIVKVSSFPLTATGKTDRKAVKNVIAADC